MKYTILSIHYYYPVRQNWQKNKKSKSQTLRSFHGALWITNNCFSGEDGEGKWRWRGLCVTEFIALMCRGAVFNRQTRPGACTEMVNEIFMKNLCVMRVRLAFVRQSSMCTTSQGGHTRVTHVAQTPPAGVTHTLPSESQPPTVRHQDAPCHFLVCIVANRYLVHRDPFGPLNLLSSRCAPKPILWLYSILLHQLVRMPVVWNMAFALNKKLFGYIWFFKFYGQASICAVWVIWYPQQQALLKKFRLALPMVTEYTRR